MADGPERESPEAPQEPLSFFAEIAPALLAVVALWAVSLWAWPRLPERVPTHWGISGKPDAWGPKSAMVFTLPGVLTGLVALVILVSRPALDFKSAKGMDPRVRRMILGLTSLLFVVLHGMMLFHLMSGTPEASPAFIWVVVGLFLVALGNQFPRLEPNQWAGIRIPPTLEDRRVWKSTHRFAAPFFMGAGMIMVLAAFLPEAIGQWVALTVLLGAIVPPIVHAYRLRSRLS
ncbi:MAG TPA: DUF1648 domain-containing protein [Holophagaceae bacterium]|nr:DUF1648 domain-containing protein [Holophagaceae bacterium]